MVLIIFSDRYIKELLKYNLYARVKRRDKMIKSLITKKYLVNNNKDQKNLILMKKNFYFIVHLKTLRNKFFIMNIF